MTTATTQENGTASHARGPRFVGRETELGSLVALLREATAGRGQLAMLVGDAGVGKTRTVEELASRCDLPQARLLWGRCPESEGAPVYWPWLQAIRSHLEGRPPAEARAALGESAHEIARLLPALREQLPGLGERESLDPAQSRFQLFDAVASFFRRSARTEPLILVLEDLHWADADSLLLLEFVAREIRGARVLVVGTYRETEMRRRAGAEQLGRIAHVGRRIALRGLARTEVEELVSRSSTLERTQGLVDELMRTTDGNPFFLGELLRALEAQHGIGAEPAAAVRLPDELRALIRQNLTPLSEDERRLLAAAAVIGREFDLIVLQRASELTAEEALARITAASSAGLVDQVPASVGRFCFRHALIRETLYGDLPASERARLHRSIALALEAQHASSAEPPFSELAHHFLAAAPLGDTERAIEYAARAGARAVALLGYEEAVGHFERALEASRLRGSTAARFVELQTALGDARWRAGDFAGARAAFEDAAREARTLGDVVGFGRAALGYSHATPEIGAVHVRLVELLEGALAALGPEDSPLRASLLGRLASALYFSIGDEVRRRGLSEQAVAMARRVGDPFAIASALLTHHFVLWGPPDGIAARREIADEMIAIAERFGDQALALEGHAWRILNLLERGDIVRLDLQLDVYGRLCEQSHLPTRRWHLRVVQATRATLAGRHGEAMRRAADAFALLPPAVDSLHGQFFASQLFFPLLEAGRLHELETSYATYAERLPAVKMWRCALALLHLHTGRPGLARAALDELASDGFASLPRDGNFAVALAELAEIAAATGDAARAQMLHALLEPWADTNLVVGLSAGSFGSARRYLGLLAATAGRADEAAAHYENALAMNAHMGARPWLAYTQVDYARLLLGRGGAGDAARAEAMLGEAARIADDLALAHLATKVRELTAGDPAARATIERPAPGAASKPPPAEKARGRRADPGSAGLHPTPAAPEPPPATVRSRASRPTERIVARLRRTAAGWTIEASGLAEAHRLRDTKGLAYLARLLAVPGQDLHSLELSATDGEPPAGRGAARGSAAAADKPRSAGKPAHGASTLDPAMRAEYRRRLVDLEDDLAEAIEFNDAGRIERLEIEREELAQEMARAVGLATPGHQSNPETGPAAERARVNVTRAIAKAVREIARLSPALGRSLDAAVRTGLLCRYDPAPEALVTWEVDA